MKTYKLWLVGILSTYEELCLNKETIDLIFAVI